MAESAVSFLLVQLSVSLRKEQELLGGLEKEVEEIRTELEQMREFLRVADANEESDSNLKQWIGQVREVSYDVEDVLDKYMLRFGQHRDTNGLAGCIRKVYASVKNLKAWHQIASEIQAIKCRLDKVITRLKKYREMYAAVDQGSSSTISNNESYDGRGDALFLEDDDVVGIEEPKHQLLEWIRSMDDGLEVISVVGMGGVGKTTLVKKIYDDESVKARFDRHVWIVVSDYKDVKLLLVNLIKKLVGEIKEPPSQDLEGMSVDDMRNFVYDFLKKKSYIIVLDDVWNISTWEVIRYALPRKGGHGCIIISTRFNSIASAACSETDHVYNLEPLPIKESRMLFYKKAFPRNPCPPYLREFAENILERCDRLPLAIVLIGGLLATKNNRVEEWEKFSRSLTNEFDEGGSLRRLQKLLSFSYNDLPYYLKYCFLYLSIFPGGGLLEKWHIISLWTAEGFVQSKQDKTMEEAADDCFNELLSRSLIQSAEKGADGEVETFRIHDLVREYITSKSREQNIVTIYKGGEMQWPNKTRRLAIQEFSDFSIRTTNFQYLRSLVLLCDINLVEPAGAIKELVSRCRLLKVLDLMGARLETIPNEVFKLYHLKYLCLINTKVKTIPTSIKYLRNLEIIYLTNSQVTELPVEILELRRLRHLMVFKYLSTLVTFDTIQSVKAPYEIGSSWLSLQELLYIDADEVDGIRTVTEIGKLTQLRELGIAKLRSKDGKELCSSLAKLTNLRYLDIYSNEENEKLDLDYSLSPARLPFLTTIGLHGWLEKVPRWIPTLSGLVYLNLHWSKLREDPLIDLQDLPNLASLFIHGAYVKGLSFKANGFQKLKTLSLVKCGFLKWVMVEKGSMLFLEDWTMQDCKLLTKLPQGMEHLTNLEYVGFVNMAKEFVERAVEDRGNQGWFASVANVRFFNMADDETLTEMQVQ